MSESVVIISILLIAVALVTIVVFVAVRLVNATRQQHAMKKRAVASERLCEHIIANITS